MVNQWAARRKGVIFLIVLVCLIIIVGIPSYLATRNQPSCSNHVKGGDESGVDCGGSCRLLCVPETLPLISRGEVRLLKIATSTYVAVIPVENPNITGSVKRAAYLFKIYSGATKMPVKAFERETYIGANSSFALFEGPFILDGLGPFRAVFEWGPSFVWEKSPSEPLLIGVENLNLINTANAAPRLEARLVNRGQKDLSNIEAIALLSDTNSNTVAAGKTFVDSIAVGESVPISFSWPSEFGIQPVSIRILPHVLPDKSYIR